MDLRFAICDLTSTSSVESRLSHRRRADSTCAVTRVTDVGVAPTGNSGASGFNRGSTEPVEVEWQFANVYPVGQTFLSASGADIPVRHHWGRFSCLPHQCSNHKSAFTLVEVMISIVIALLLVVGISQIFSIAQRTTGAGTQVLAAVETNRGIQATLKDDFLGLVNGDDSPGLVIISQSVPTFRNRPDQQQDRDGLPNTLNDTAGNGSLRTMSWSDVNYRMHRVDRICFFTRGSFHRQTADAPSYVSGTSASEAFVWMGHLALPNNAAVNSWNAAKPASPTDPNGRYFRPAEPPVPGPNAGSKANDNNYFATDWALGRQVILLASLPPNASVSNLENGFAAVGQNPLSLLQPAVSGRTDHQPLFASRYDLAYTTIDSYRQLEGSSNVWWEGMGGVQPPLNVPNFDIRYYANPFPQKPRVSDPQPAAWMSAAVAQTTPVFIRGCTQFIVEFAGDFVTQNPDGTIPQNGNQPDGQIDFNVDRLTGAHSIRWYGFPRNAGDETNANQPTIGVVNGPTGYQFGVCPLHDTTKFAGNTQPAPERPPFLASQNNYVNWQSSYNANATYPYSQPYIVAWGPDTAGFPKPKMIRITIAVDDPAGHLNTEQTYEYVFNLP